MVKGPGEEVITENGEKQNMISSKLRSSVQHSEARTMDSFQDGGQRHMNAEHSEYPSGMEGAYINPEVNSYGPNPGEQAMGSDNYNRMNEGFHGQSSQYNSYNRPGFSMESNMGDFSNHNAGYGQYPQSGVRGGFPGMPRPSIGPIRPGMGTHGASGMMGFSPNQQRMMSGQSISQQSGPTPTLNQLLQTPNSQPRFTQNNFEGYSGPQKGDMAGANNSYGMPQGWMQNQRGMGNYPPMSMTGSGYRGQGPGYNQQGFSQSVPLNSQSQYNSSGSIQQQPQPPGQPPGSSPQQRPTPQPSPHQPISPAPSPVQRITPNPSPGPARPPAQPSPGQQRSSQQPSPSPSQRSSSSQLSPPGSSPGQHNSVPSVQHNHQSSPKESLDDVKGESTAINSSRPEPSPGSVGSRSNTPASNISGTSPMPPRPLSQQDGAQNNSRMSQSPMSAPGYSQQMMPPPMGPNQMGGYSQGGKMGPGSYPAHFQNSQYPQSGNYPVRPPGPGMAGYQQNMYNGPNQMSGPPGGQPVYNNMAGGPGMNRNNYMYGGQGMAPTGMNSQYGGNYGAGGPTPPNSQGGPGMTSAGPNTNGPQGNMNSLGSGISGSNGPMPGSGQPVAPGQGQTPIKGAQAAAQAAMAAASAAARSQAQQQSNRHSSNPSQPSRMFNPASMGPHSMPPQSMSPLSQMGQMNQMAAYNSPMNSLSPHPQNSLSPGPNSMGQQQNMSGKMHNSASVNSYGEQLLPKSKSSKSKSVTNSALPPSNVPNNLHDKHSNSSASPQGSISSPLVPDSSIPSTQQLPSSTPTSSLSDASSHSNDSSSMGPVINNDSSVGGPSGPVLDNSISTSIHETQKGPMDDRPSAQNDDHHPITTTANNICVETTTTVTQSITSPVTSISTEAGNSNDSQPLPLEPVPSLPNCIPAQHHISDEPPEKKKKTDGSSVSQLPFARVAPSPGGASVASSGTHEDIDNIGSPPGWSAAGTAKNTGDYMKLYEMGMEQERRPFLDRLFAFLEEKGSPITNMPVISKQPLDLYRLYLCVRDKGGMVEVTKAKKWKEICGMVNISGSASAAFTLKKNYIKFLFGFECRFDRGNMDPTPILTQMENDLEKKRMAKQKNRAPSPAGSQNSQDGIQNASGNQYMQNDPNMGHMGPGMMGNHMMNNMGPHGPMMGPNNMPGHHMQSGMQGPGIQGPPGHMMPGNMPPQNMMGGNSGYMMQGGPNNMMGNNMGPQGSMMGPGPNTMMGNMPPGPQSGNMMQHNMNQHGMMNNMNVPHNNNMMPGAMNQSGMMPPNTMNQQPMMRNNMSQSGPGAAAPMVPPQPSGGNSSPMVPPQPPCSSSGPMVPPPSSMMRGNSDSISCQDPFADEPFSRPNVGAPMPPYPGMPQSGTGIPQSTSPMPPSSGPAQPQSNMPSNTSSSSSNNSVPMNSGKSDMLPNSAGPTPGDMRPNSAGPPPGMMHPQSSQPQSNSDMPPQSLPMTGQISETSQPSSGVSQMSGISQQNSGSAPTMTTASMPASTSVSTVSQPNMFNQDSNSNSSLPGDNARPLVDSMAPQGMPQQSMPPQSNGTTSTSSQFSNSTNMPSVGSTRQFPFGDQFKTERFDQSSPGMPQQATPPMSQAPMMNQMSHGNPPMPNQQQPATSQAAGPNQPPSMSQANGMNQSSMNYPHQGMNQSQSHMNHQQPMDSTHMGRFGNQIQGPDQFNQGYQGNFGPRPQGMNGDQYQGYPNQQGQFNKPPMNRDMSGSIYNTPNKRFPDGRNEPYMSPAYNPRGSMSFDDRTGPMHYPSRYPDHGVDNSAYGSQSYSGSSGMNYSDPNTSQYHQYSDYNTDAAGQCTDRRDQQGQWSPMPPQRGGFHGVPPYGPPPPPGMSPSGPPNMNHMTRMRMSPDRNRSFSMSPNNKQKMIGSGMHGPYKKDMHFPLDTVESTQPLLNKRKKLTKHDIGPLGYKPNNTGNRRTRSTTSEGQVEAWRVMMALKSGLLAESTWALDTLNILLFDDSTVAYFGLGHLPGLLEVLLDHFRRNLIDMFDLFDETQIGCGHDDFKQNLIRMAILESAKENVSDVNIGMKEINMVNRNIVKFEDTPNSSKESSVEKDSVEPNESKSNGEGEEAMEIDEDKEAKKSSTEEMVKDLKSRKNYTMISRQGKEVKFEDDSDPNGLLDEKFWDVYCEFGDQSDLWEYGKGDMTEHILTHLEDVDEHARCKRKFFHKSKKVKQHIEMNELEVPENKSDSVKCEAMETDVTNSSSENEKEVESKSPLNTDNSEHEKLDSCSDNTSCNCDSGSEEKEHSCNKFLKGVTIKSEPRDSELEKVECDDAVCSEKEIIIEKSFFSDEPRIKLAVKFELLDDNELVQTCKNSFGINTEGERNSVEDESYQRNEPPLCLTSEAQHEIGKRCVCISNIFRSLSCIPGNDTEMSRHAGLVYIFGKLLLLHHRHLPRSRARRKFDRDDVDEEMVDTSQGIEEWWWDYLNMLRENTLVIFANICAQLRLDLFPDEICTPTLDGLLHWVVCPSSCASDPLPTVSATSVLSPIRLVLEALCKLCIHDRNVDMLLAMPSYERIVQLFSVLAKLLANKNEQVTMEFSIVLLSELVQGGSSAARGVALQHPTISLLIDFLETAEQKAAQVASMHSMQMLRDSPEMMGTSLDMLRRAATVLLHLAKVPENRKLFVHHQSRILSLVMSHILDPNVGSILSDVLFQCSHFS